jgi:hypothetical protein
VLDRKQIREHISYRVREQLFLRLDAVAYDNRSTTESIPFKRKFYSIRPHVDWRFHRSWLLTGGVDLRSQDQCRAAEDVTCEDLGQSGRATSNRVFLGVTFASEPFGVFR